MAARTVILVILLAFVGIIVFSVDPTQRVSILATLTVTLGAITALYRAVLRR
jgi:hypothetical protein